MGLHMARMAVEGGRNASKKALKVIVFTRFYQGCFRQVADVYVGLQVIPRHTLRIRLTSLLGPYR